MRTFCLLWLAIPVFNTLSQIFIKLAAEHTIGVGWTWLEHTVTSPWMIAAVGVEAACFVVWMQVLSEVDLSKAFPISAVSYILVMVASWLLFRESITSLQLVGSGLILGGVWLISTASPNRKGNETRTSFDPKMRTSTDSANQAVK